MVAASKSLRGPASDRAKSSKSVRLNDRQGFDHKFNKTGFKSETKRHLYYYYVKCYEQVLRGEEAGSVLTKRDFSGYRRLAETRPLRPLPDGFRNFKVPDKIETLIKLIDEQLDADDDGIAHHFEDVESSRDEGKMEVDEGSVAYLGPECSVNETSKFLHGDSLQSVAESFHDHPQGRPPTCCNQLLEELLEQLVSEFKRMASCHSDIVMEVEGWGQQGMALVSKLRDRDILESVGLDASNTLVRSRQKEILSQLQEDIAVKDPLTPFTDSSMKAKNAEHGGGVWAYPKQGYAVDPRSTASSSLMAPPDHRISEALKFTPTYTGRLKANLEEIHPEVAGGGLQYQLSKPTMESGGPQVSHPQVSDFWGNKQFGGGDYSMAVPHSGGSSVSQIAAIGRSVSPELLALEQLAGEVAWPKEQQWIEPTLEGSPSPLWTHSSWHSPVYE